MKAVRLGARDYELLGVLAEARCLTTEQVKRLFFCGEDDSAARKRLKKLASESQGLVRRIEWYGREGVSYAWTLTAAGYVEAEKVLGVELEVPRDDIAAEFLAHHVLLSELLVGLLAGPLAGTLQKLAPSMKRKQELGRVHARARHPGFRWMVVGDRDLPWKQPTGAKLEARVLRPDAFLELPTQRRRIFVESEMGTHTIATVSASKTGATTAKIERYEAFCTLVTGAGTRRTWYADRFPDGLQPEVLFLVRSAVRQVSVQRALDDWRRTHPNAVCGFRVATVEHALRELLPLLGYAAPDAAEPLTAKPEPLAAKVFALGKGDLDALAAYYASVEAYFKPVRARARAEKKDPPPYPVPHDAIYALLTRLGRPPAKT